MRRINFLILLIYNYYYNINYLHIAQQIQLSDESDGVRKGSFIFFIPLNFLVLYKYSGLFLFIFNFKYFENKDLWGHRLWKKFMCKINSKSFSLVCLWVTFYFETFIDNFFPLHQFHQLIHFCWVLCKNYVPANCQLTKWIENFPSIH